MQWSDAQLGHPTPTH